MRYGPNFRQELDDTDFDRLPEFATYEGEAEDLRHLRGILIPTRDVERVVYVGERENVWVEMPDGARERPWLNCYIYEVDAAGNVVTDIATSPMPEYGPRAMSTADLSSYGYTDSWLIEQAQALLGEVYEPDRVGPSDKRRDVFDRVMARLDA